MPVRPFTAIPRVVAIAVAMLCFVLPITAKAEIYKWVDKSGRVHFADKKHADENAQRMDAQAEDEIANPNHLVIYPDADALLSESSKTAQGYSRVLSAGVWSIGEQSMQNTSLIHFDLSNLLTAVHGGKGRTIVSAQLKLFANTEDRIYNQNNNPDTPNFSNSNGDNGFFLLPTRNNWEESSITWADFYSTNQYIPSTIRKLPSIPVENSKKAAQDCDVDVRELLNQIVLGNLRELSLEIKLQRLQAMTQVTLYSREADFDKRPVLIIELQDNSKERAAE